MAAELLVFTQGRVGRLRLSRPSALHALTCGMIRAMSAALSRWAQDPAVAAVVIDHAEGRGFCAGGDIAQLRRSALTDQGASGREFFHEEYRLNHQLFLYPKPAIAFMDGVTMGGGVGIARPARFRVATENTRLAMPETGIGLFPDVGAGWYLSRLPGRIGAFLALTGARLDGAECCALGFATHYLPGDRLDEAKAQIAADPDSIETVLARLSAPPPPARILGNSGTIDRLFASDRYEDILAALASDRGDWAQKEFATLRRKSPLSCKVALRELAASRMLTDFADEMRMEYRIACRMLLQPDFAEGVRALIVDKDNAPRWHPAVPEDLGTDVLEAIFAPLAAAKEWTPLPA